MTDNKKSSSVFNAGKLRNLFVAAEVLSIREPAEALFHCAGKRALSDNSKIILRDLAENITSNNIRNSAGQALLQSAKNAGNNTASLGERPGRHS